MGASSLESTGCIPGAHGAHSLSGLKAGFCHVVCHLGRVKYSDASSSYHLGCGISVCGARVCVCVVQVCVAHRACRTPGGELRTGVADTSQLTLTDTSRLTPADTSQLTLADTSQLTLADTSQFTLADTSRRTLADTSGLTLADTSRICQLSFPCMLYDASCHSPVCYMMPVVIPLYAI